MHYYNNFSIKKIDPECFKRKQLIKIVTYCDVVVVVSAASAYS